MKYKKPPETLYGHWHNDGSRVEDAFVRVDGDPKTLVEPNTTTRVGVYKLVGFADITNVTKTSNVTEVKKVGK